MTEMEKNVLMYCEETLGNRLIILLKFFYSIRIIKHIKKSMEKMLNILQKKYTMPSEKNGIIVIMGIMKKDTNVCLNH